ncbi:MAG: amino acid permease [Planctomycetota bacterium]
MPAEHRKLKKELTLFGVYTLATGATLSSGFFLLPGLAVEQVGAAVFISYLLSVLPLLPGILSKLELATAMPRSGGEYYFLDRSLGPLAGTISGFGTWCGLVLKTAFALIGIGAYLKVFFPGLPMRPLVAGVAILFGILNLLGAHKSSKLQAVLVNCLLLLLLWFLGAGVANTNLSHFEGIWENSWSQIFATSGLVCVSFMGLTKAASVSEEVKDPERNLTLGILLAIATAIVVYGLGTVVLVGAVAPAEMAGSLTPVADAARVLGGSTGAGVMTVAAILAFLSVGNAGIMSASRYPLAMSRDHLIPSWFRRLNSHNSPSHAIILTTAVIVLFVTLLDPTKIAKLASTFLLMLFAMNCLAVIVMRESRIESYDPGFRSPWYPWMQIIGIAGPMAYIIVMGWLPMIFAAGIVTVGAAWYFYYASSRVVRGGAIYHLLARLGQRRFEGLDRELRGILKEKGLRDKDPYDEVVAHASVIEADTDDTFEDIVLRASEKLSASLQLKADQLFRSFMEGTRIGATPVSKGVALPHLRLSGLEQPIMVLARSRNGVRVDVELEYVDHTPDQAIHAIIFLVSSEENAAQHLRVLAQIAQNVDQEEFTGDWLAAAHEQHLRETLLRNERFIALHLQTGSPSSAMIGARVSELAWPEDTLVALVHRNGQVVVPRGRTKLEEGDRLTIVGLPESIQKIRNQYLDEYME